jgi:hypothetical protein
VIARPRPFPFSPSSVNSAIQTFGDRINFHPHLHFLVTEGGMDETGVFQAIPQQVALMAAEDRVE